MERPFISFFPDYRRSNPYQSLLYGAAQGWHAVAEDLTAAHTRLKQGHRSIFHLHWTAPLFKSVTTEESFRARSREVLDQIKAYRAEGGYLLWTIHNGLPHARIFKQAEIDFRRGLAEQVDRIHLHDTAAIEQVTKLYPLPTEKIRIAAHGHMIGAYKQGRLQSLFKPGPSRKKLGLTGTSPIAAVIGQLRPNKGIEDFISAVPDAPIQALLAGRVTPKASQSDFAARCRDLGIVFKDGFVPAPHMPALFDLTDMIVLPYRENLTSGSLVLALSMAKPVIVPHLRSFDSMKDKSFASFYTPGDPQSLTAALTGMAHRSDLQTMGQAAKAYIAQFTWDDMAKALFANM